MCQIVSTVLVCIGTALVTHAHTYQRTSEYMLMCAAQITGRFLVREGLFAREDAERLTTKLTLLGLVPDEYRIRHGEIPPDAETLLARLRSLAGRHFGRNQVLPYYAYGGLLFAAGVLAIFAGRTKAHGELDTD